MTSEMAPRKTLRALLHANMQQLHNLTIFYRECVEAFGRDEPVTILAQEAMERLGATETALAGYLADSKVDLGAPSTRLEVVE